MTSKFQKFKFWVMGILVISLISILTFFVMQRMGTNSPEEFTENFSEISQKNKIIDRQRPMPSDEAYRRLMDSADEKAKKAEAKRLAEWKANFPYKPVTSKATTVTEEIKNLPLADSIKFNHSCLRVFFENEWRFSRQFQDLHRILEEGGRADNPVVAGFIFRNLWEYHEAMKEDPEKVVMTGYDEERRPLTDVTGKIITYGIRAQEFSDGIVYELGHPSEWPDREITETTEAEMEALRDRIISEVKGMDEIPPPGPGFMLRQSYMDELEVGEQALTPYPGWQEAYNKWEEEVVKPYIAKEELNQQFGEITKEGFILNKLGENIIFDESEDMFGFIITETGEKVPLILDEKNQIKMPSDEEILQLRAEGKTEFLSDFENFEDFEIEQSNEDE